MAVVDVFDAGVDPQFGGFEQTGEAPVLPMQDLPLDQ